MKKITFKLLLSIVLIFGFISCKKEPIKHKVTYQINFLETPGLGSSDFISYGASPSNHDLPVIRRGEIPKTWKYEYFGLTEGTEVVFSFRGQLSYRYEMIVYIDDVEKSYVRVKTSDDVYYATKIEERRGLVKHPESNGGLICFDF
jgi:hypothetical protein